jgi:hypothetical protein
MAILDIACEVPGLCDIDTTRLQFQAIWSKNTVLVEVQRFDRPQAGDYFHDDESPGPVVRTIWMNVQGTSSNFYRRDKFGITSTESRFHAYTRWYEDIQNNDRIIWDGKMYVVENWNRSLYGGQIVFQEFDLKVVDKDTPAGR